MNECCCRVFVATSLDGFIARTDGSIDWLEEANRLVPDGEDFGYQLFFEETDVLVMGRKTFEKCMSFESWPYGPKPVIVMSRTLESFPSATPDTVRLSGRSPREVCHQLAENGLTRVYLDGGATVRSFLDDGLVDSITITTIPILIGAGIPLFGELEQEIKLELVESKSYSFGFVQNTYRVLPNLA
jgi:dihydrofolate reductase